MTVPMFGAQQEQTTTDDRYTPPWIFDALGVKFDIDVCAPPGGVPWIPATRFFTVADDGLVQDWDGTVWCNPPFSNPLPWITKMAAHDDGVFLGAISANAKWCEFAFATCAVFAPLIFIRFAHEDKALRKIPVAVGLFGYGDKAAEAIIGSSAFTAMRAIGEQQ